MKSFTEMCSEKVMLKNKGVQKILVKIHEKYL